MLAYKKKLENTFIIEELCDTLAFSIEINHHSSFSRII